MTDFSDLKAQIADYANRQDWSDVLVTGFIRQCEQKLNQDLRVDRMVQTDSSVIYSRCAQLPDDWLDMDFVSIATNTCRNNPNGWAPLEYKPRKEFFNLSDQCAIGFYTLEGREIFFGGVPDATAGVAYKISYFGEVPVFTDAKSSWIYTKYPSLYLYGSLMHADLHAVGEEDKAGAMKQLTESMISQLNANHLRSKASGSRLSRSRVRSFG